MPRVKPMMNMQPNYVELSKFISLPITFMTSQVRSGICSLLTLHCHSETQAVPTAKYLKENCTFCSSCFQSHSLLERKKENLLFSLWSVSKRYAQCYCISYVNLLKSDAALASRLNSLSAYGSYRFLYFSSH